MTFHISLHEILCCVTVIQLWLFALFLAWPYPGRSPAHRLLALFLFIKSLGIVTHLLARRPEILPDVLFLLVPFIFVWSPVMDLYVRATLEPDFSLRRRHGLHLLPFLLSAGYFLTVYHLQSDPVKARIVAGLDTATPVAAGVMEIGYLVQVLAYLVVAAFHVNRHRAALPEPARRWLALFLGGFGLIWLADGGLMLARLLGKRSPMDPWGSLVMVLIFGYANLVLYMGWRHPQLFSGNGAAPRYRYSPLSTADKADILRRLQASMAGDKAFLDPNMTLSRCGRRLGITPRYISQVLNETLATTFTDFINEYRIAEACTHLAAPHPDDRSIMEIMLASGFTNKSTFYRVFRKHTGRTPLEYRQRATPAAVESALRS
ncbi:MAG: AraC family transcriptional regulator [Acidobacteria bacterium]|nr:AraC family transcriptional regulator [Acidobacteriota bacterium]